MSTKAFATCIVGDSHAAFLLGNTVTKLVECPRCRAFSLWVGPQTMYSAQRRGFDLDPEQLGAVRRWRPPRLLVTLGEIDARMFLGIDPVVTRQVWWTESFIDLVSAFGDENGFARIGIVSPVSMSDHGDTNPDFPRRGTLRDRIEGHRWLCDALATAIRKSSDTRLTFIDIRRVLESPTGQLGRVMTSDGTHISGLARSLIWRQISRTTEGA